MNYEILRQNNSLALVEFFIKRVNILLCVERVEAVYSYVLFNSSLCVSSIMINLFIYYFKQ